MGIPGKQGSIGAPNSACMFAGLLEMSSLEQTQTKPPNCLGTFFGFLGLLQDLIVYVFITLLFCCCCWLLWVFVAKCEISLAAVLSAFSNCSTRAALVDSQIRESQTLRSCPDIPNENLHVGTIPRCICAIKRNIAWRHRSSFPLP